MKNPSKLRVLDTIENVHLAKGIVAKAKWTMALSYHVQVFALAMGCPIAIIYSGSYYKNKALGMQLLIGDEVPLINLDETSSTNLVQVMEFLDTSPEALSFQLAQAKQAILENNDKPIFALGNLLHHNHT